MYVSPSNEIQLFDADETLDHIGCTFAMPDEEVAINGANKLLLWFRTYVSMHYRLLAVDGSTIAHAMADINLWKFSAYVTISVESI